ncbi:MAG: ribosomal protein [Mycobacterium sp.]|jgi:large subunit ribosomal protein L9|nr:ribosomal protein [Mycobacterium sp.]MCW2745143.1 ribosomal protein [Mycobacterium sp.]
MKLVLTSEVTGLGGPGEVVEVKDGYGRNYLVPRGLAVQATRGVEKQVAQLRKAREVREVRDLGQAQELANQLAGLNIVINARSGKDGRLFGSITAHDVVEAVLAAGGPKLDRRRVELLGPIKTAGGHTVSVRLHPEVAAQVRVEVIAA